MKKAFLQFLVLLLVFFSSWLLLSQLNFMKYIHVDRITKKTEHKLGDLIMDNIREQKKEINNDSVQKVLNELKLRICSNNNINADDIKLHLFSSEEINAFTLPDKHMIIYTGLIKYCKNADELAGVMAHEIGHMEKNHVMKKLVKETGLAVVVSIASGSGNPAIITKILQLLSSTAFDRKQESEADAYAVRYLKNAHIDPAALANLFTRLRYDKPATSGQFDVISTHPSSKDRAAEILKLRGPDTYVTIYTPALDTNSWHTLKSAANNYFSGYSN